MLLCGARGLHLTTAGIHATQPYRAKDDGHGQSFVKQFGFQAERRHVLKNTLPQCDLSQIFHVTP
ncbi:hypothetical protein D3C78_1774820 [compost metagenome]